jgi:hypothetical protein
MSGNARSDDIDSAFHPKADIASAWLEGPLRATTGRVVTPLPEGPGVAGQEAVVQGLADFVRPG